MQHNFKDETGNVYGKLKVIRYHGSNKAGNAMWECECECGNKTVVSGICLRRGGSKSCGCYRADWSRKNKVIHGMNRVGKTEPLYVLWCNIKDRCHNPNATAYKNYGSRGITVCDEWRNNFVPFMKWAQTNGYEHGLELDRIDNDKGYSPDNCHFVTRLENARNRRNNRRITYKGKTQTMSEWAEEIGMSLKTLWRRFELGWSVEDALNRPLRERKIS